MLKSLLLAAAFVLGVSSLAEAKPQVGPLPAVPALPGQSPSQPPQPGQPEPRVKLYYRECVHEQWKYVGCFECIHDAQDYAAPLQKAGYQVFFRNCR